MTFTLGTNVENLTLTGAGAINGTGSTDNNILTGNTGANSLSGANGTDTLAGGLGNDTLGGGAGNDAFLFDSALGAGNIDSVTDMTVAADQIRLAQSIFTAIGAGTLAASAFVVGSAATTVDHRIIYDSTTGALSYDADGTGAGAAQQFATLQTGLALTNADFIGV